MRGLSEAGEKLLLLGQEAVFASNQTLGNLPGHIHRLQEQVNQFRCDLNRSVARQIKEVFEIVKCCRHSLELEQRRIAFQGVGCTEDGRDQLAVIGAALERKERL